MSDVNEKEKNGIYINGRQQVIELLKHMDVGQKNTLLKNLKSRSPALAKELSELCFSFENLWNLEDNALSKVLLATNPIIIGLAIHYANSKIQKRVLSLLPRSSAVKAYEIMIKDLSKNKKECFRAQDKLVETALELSRKKIISFH